MDTYSWWNAVLRLGVASSMTQMHCHPIGCGSDCTLTARHNCERHGDRRAGVGYRDSCAVNYQQMWRRATVGIHVQLFAPNHIVLRPPLGCPVQNGIHLGAPSRSCLCVLCYALCARSSHRAALGVGSGGTPQMWCAHGGRLNGVVGTRKCVVNSS